MKNQSKCQRCQVPIQSNRMTQRFCSPRCRMAAQRLRRREWRQAYDQARRRRPDFKVLEKAYSAKWWDTRGREQARIPAEQWYRGVCRACGAPVCAVRAGGKPRYCSTACKRRFRYERGILEIKDAQLRAVRAFLLAWRRRTDARCVSTRNQMLFIKPYLVQEAPR